MVNKAALNAFLVLVVVVLGGYAGGLLWHWFLIAP
jgi:hypothetical protein